MSLKDVALLLGIPIDEEAVTRVTSEELLDHCRQLLGLVPYPLLVKGTQ